MKPYLMRSSVRSSAHNRAGGNWLKGGSVTPTFPLPGPTVVKHSPKNFGQIGCKICSIKIPCITPPMFSYLPQPLHKVLGHCVTIRACLFVLSDSIIRKTQRDLDHLVVKFQVSSFVNINFKIAKSFKISS